MNYADRISYNTASSATVQDDLAAIIGQLESLLATRDAQVSRAMADFTADGVSEQYAAVEQRWRRASEQVRSIIALVKTTLARNDEIATAAQQRAATAVANIG